MEARKTEGKTRLGPIQREIIRLIKESDGIGYICGPVPQYLQGRAMEEVQAAADRLIERKIIKKVSLFGYSLTNAGRAAFGAQP